MLEVARHFFAKQTDRIDYKKILLELKRSRQAISVCFIMARLQTSEQRLFLSWLDFLLEFFNEQRVFLSWLEFLLEFLREQRLFYRGSNSCMINVCFVMARILARILARATFVLSWLKFLLELNLITIIQFNSR